MPRAERRKRKQDEELQGAAAKIPKLTSFFKPSTTTQKSAEVEQSNPSSAGPLDGILLPTPSVSDGPMFPGGTICSEPSESPLSPEHSEGILSEPSEVPLSPWHSEDILSTGPSEDNNPSRLSEGVSSDQFPCVCCSQDKPYHPSSDEIKKTSFVQLTGKDKQLRSRLCPLAIFDSHPWITYCLQKGTISCFFCKRSRNLKLVQVMHNGKDAFSTQTFADWKKCAEKVKKHEDSQFHKEAVMKVTLHDTALTSVVCMVDEQMKSAQSARRTSLLKQLSSMRYLGCQGIGSEDTLKRRAT